MLCPYMCIYPTSVRTETILLDFLNVKVKEQSEDIKLKYQW